MDQEWAVRHSRYLFKERAIPENVLQLHLRVRQECGSTGGAVQEEPGFCKGRSGIWGNDTNSTCSPSNLGCPIVICVFSSHCGGLRVSDHMRIQFDAHTKKETSAFHACDYVFIAVCLTFLYRAVRAVPISPWNTTCWSLFRDFPSISSFSQVRDAIKLIHFKFIKWFPVNNEEYTQENNTDSNKTFWD